MNQSGEVSEMDSATHSKLDLELKTSQQLMSNT